MLASKASNDWLREGESGGGKANLDSAQNSKIGWKEREAVF